METNWVRCGAGGRVTCWGARLLWPGWAAVADCWPHCSWPARPPHSPVSPSSAFYLSPAVAASLQPTSACSSQAAGQQRERLAASLEWAHLATLATSHQPQTHTQPTGISCPGKTGQKTGKSDVLGKGGCLGVVEQGWLAGPHCPHQRNTPPAERHQHNAVNQSATSIAVSNQ